jgi:hypothetical protein
MRAILIVLSMSLCTFAGAQKALDWQIKLGVYTEYYTLPTLSKGAVLKNTDSKTFGTISLGFYMRKWNSLVQFNFDTRITFKQGDFRWAINRANSVRGGGPYIPTEIGDTVALTSYYSNFSNILYRFFPNSERHSLYAGIGLMGRYDRVSYVSYVDFPNPWPVQVDGYQKIRIAPTIKAEYQFNVTKRLLLSTYLNYSLFANAPHSYWQFALNGGIRF